ncbi:uncharacterized protein Z519_01103 [Cladophialophora bantiana CBS 173.52]|uniref:Uncharacterized protein n=1 Tax=Cladophialophora bantiana (strain ATCC 10958 / CBS 173.52 / CDC B-1940 / NIH 8579) TaxID=1442370 RepID=A0A0D2IL78_CLAB1|nr:uncharacterized protein Z519_01103 [Cladophialophora bantiana CBS 173.52]KIW97519.1 hypothetical protein Z519_01103 [Cladophialophora bantiana CBS 173.52]
MPASRLRRIQKRGGKRRLRKRRPKESERVYPEPTDGILGFATRRNLVVEDWNQPFVESISFVQNDDEGLIRAFMIDRNEPEACQLQAKQFDWFCGSGGLDK